MRGGEHRVTDKRNRGCTTEQGDMWISINSRGKKRREKKLSVIIWLFGKARMQGKKEKL